MRGARNSGVCMSSVGAKSVREAGVNLDVRSEESALDRTETARKERQ